MYCPYSWSKARVNQQTKYDFTDRDGATVSRIGSFLQSCVSGSIYSFEVIWAIQMKIALVRDFDRELVTSAFKPP